MLNVFDRASFASALNEPHLDPDLRALIALRVGQLSHDAKLFVIQGGDTPDVINAVVGFAITGADAEAFDYDVISDHGRWFEIALILNNVPTRIFVENDPGTELGIHYLCLAHFWPDEEGGGR